MILTMNDRTRPAAPLRPIATISVLLIPDFSLLSYSGALEPFRAANKLSGRELYSWTHISPNGLPVRASNGVQIVPDSSVRDPLRCDMLMVCAGGNPSGFRDGATLALLREAARTGVLIAGISAGPLIMARAGLLEGYRCTIHWEHAPAFREEFPDYDFKRSIYEIDRDRLTCAGGTSSLDLMHLLIAAQHGPDLANAMAEWFLHSHIRVGDENQRMAVRERLAVRHPKLIVVLEAMEKALERPKSRDVLAQSAGISVRQLERLFRTYLGRSIAEHYKDLRLLRARQLLMQTTLSVLEVAVATGFVSASHFSRAYRSRFDRPPRSDQRPPQSAR